MSTVAHAEAHQQDGEQQIDPAHAGGLDSKDSRSHANTVAAELAREKEEKKAEEEADEVRPTDLAKAVRLIARSRRAHSKLTRFAQHGNKPSQGAVIDERIEDEERAELERKGKA